jgi:hypothetical protein
MTDLETLRQALQVQEEPGATLDLPAIIKRGRRLRGRRRLLAVAAGTCAAAAVFGAVTGITHLTRPAIAPAQGPAGSSHSVPGPSPSRAVTVPPSHVVTPARPWPTPSPSRSLPGPSPARSAVASPRRSALPQATRGR